MSRTLPTGFSDDVAASEVEPFIAVELLFDDNDFRVWNGIGPITVDSKTFEGAGTLLNVSVVEETVEIAARGVQFTMSGLSSELLSLALSEPYQGRVARLYFGVFPTDGSAAHMTEVFSGFMDVMHITDSGDTATISISAENRLIALERVRTTRYTPEDHKRNFPDDKGLEFVADLQDKEIKWSGG